MLSETPPQVGGQPLACCSGGGPRKPPRGTPVDAVFCALARPRPRPPFGPPPEPRPCPLRSLGATSACKSSMGAALSAGPPRGPCSRPESMLGGGSKRRGRFADSRSSFSPSKSSSSPSPSRARAWSVPPSGWPSTLRRSQPISCSNASSSPITRSPPDFGPDRGDFGMLAGSDVPSLIPSHGSSAEPSSISPPSGAPLIDGAAAIELLVAGAPDGVIVFVSQLPIPTSPNAPMSPSLAQDVPPPWSLSCPASSPSRPCGCVSQLKSI
mmetsp:Transcript_57235/g.127770  ORF Transcript_57235/g.127770 Transcript_57235/m.127770 type:complete len:268 (-) Transcript_57235:85-888(-)